MEGRRPKSDRPPPALVALASFFFALPLPITMLAVRFGPSGFDPKTSVQITENAPLLAAAGLLAGLVLFRTTLGRRRVVSFLVALGCSILALQTASVLLAVFVHRDFFSPAFQYALSVPVVFLFRLRTLEGTELSRNAMRMLGRAGYVTAAFYAEWIILMGYAIVTRAEPRPIEAMIYNAYNIPLALVLVLSSRGVERRALRTLSIGAEGIAVDGKSVDAMLGERRSILLTAFVAAPDRRLRCPDVQKALGARAHGAVSDRAEKAGCDGCNANGSKATACAEYRSTYNSLLELKKMLEFLEIGSIGSPGNRRRVLADGWKLTLFENARIVRR